MRRRMKRILLDQNIPRKLAGQLAPHRVETAANLGWAALTNGELITAAENDGFDILLTADQNLQYQQNLAERRITIIVLDTNRWRHIEAQVSVIRAAVEAAGRGRFQIVECFRR